MSRQPCPPPQLPGLVVDLPAAPDVAQQWRALPLEPLPRAQRAPRLLMASLPLPS